MVSRLFGPSLNLAFHLSPKEEQNKEKVLLCSNLVKEKDRVCFLHLGSTGTIYCNFLALPTRSDSQFHFYTEVVKSNKENLLSKLKGAIFGKINSEELTKKYNSKLELLSLVKEREDLWNMTFADLLGEEIGFSRISILEEMDSSRNMIRTVQSEVLQKVNLKDSLIHYERKNILSGEDKLLSIDILDLNFHLTKPRLLEIFVAYKSEFEGEVSGQKGSRIGLQLINFDWVVYIDELLFSLALFTQEAPIFDPIFRIVNLKSKFFFYFFRPICFFFFVYRWS